MNPSEARLSVDCEFVLGVEHECLTIVEPLPVPEADPAPSRFARTVRHFFDKLKGLAPTLGQGTDLFNGYGRVYLDCGDHIEFASAESHSPYALATLIETQQCLARLAVEQCVADGSPRLRLANNNHSDLLSPSAPTWGSHENYLVPQPPHEFSEQILPFLVTRIYGGAGGVRWPSGAFLAATRPLFMMHAVGGQTMGDRAVHSTVRDEPLMDPGLKHHRYHLILGDGHRSQFNTALQVGATALALKAIQFDPDLASRTMAAVLPEGHGSWVSMLRRYNRLARPGAYPQVQATVIAIQRAYLDGACRWAEGVEDLPQWVPSTLEDWRATLEAFECQDRAWLASRLDAFAKYEVFSAVLAEAGSSWKELPCDRELFSHMALVDQSYHSFTDPDSVFDVLEANGSMNHRVAPLVLAGSEAEPFVPGVKTRAAARARWLRENALGDRYAMGWQSILDQKERRRLEFRDPRSTEKGKWTDLPGRADLLVRRRRQASLALQLELDLEPGSQRSPGSTSESV